MKTLMSILLGVLMTAGPVMTDGAWSYDSYLLTVQQLRSGLSKAPSPDKKGFVSSTCVTQEQAPAQFPGRISI